MRRMKKVMKQETEKPDFPVTGPCPKHKLRTGYMVFGALLSVKIIEYAVAVSLRSGAWPYLLALAIVSAGLIVYYYKHIHQLWDVGKRDE
jgi:hypothetical protein